MRKFFLQKSLISNGSKREIILPVSEKIGAYLHLFHLIEGEGFSDMKEDDENELIKSHNIGHTKVKLIEIVENKNLETDSED